MAKKPVHEQFSDEEMEAIKRYGQALGGNPTPFDEEVEKHLAGYDLYHEANARKMREAQTGGTALGPSDIEQEQAQTQQGQAKNVAAQQAQQAAQAQGAQTQQQPPAAPSGPVGVSTPYEAQKGPQEAPSAANLQPQPGGGLETPGSKIQPPQPGEEQS